MPAFEVFDATSKNVIDVGMGPFGYILGRNTATIPMSHGPLFGMDGRLVGIPTMKIAAGYGEESYEGLAFAIQVAWRLVYARYDDAGRVAFMTMLANRAGEELAENRARLLGEADPAAIKAAFIELLNRRTEEYAEFGHGPEGPDFAFLRYFATSVAELMPEKDKRWTWDQVIAIEGPEAASTLAKSVAGLFDEAPRRKRRPALTEG